MIVSHIPLIEFLGVMKRASRRRKIVDPVQIIRGRKWGREEEDEDEEKKKNRMMIEEGQAKLYVMCH